MNAAAAPHESRLPYFDDLIRAVAADPAAIDPIGWNMHWGLILPGDDVGSLETQLAATTRLTEMVCRAAHVHNNSAVLDVGCGFGGTMRHLNDRLADTKLVGLNIDPRQLRFIRDRLSPRNGNSIVLLEGEGSSIGLHSHSFDTIVAIESLFHVESRWHFFREARRLLADDGRIVITDFLVDGSRLDDWLAVARSAQATLGAFFGHAPSGHITLRRYERHAAAVGMRIDSDEDLTDRIIPSMAGLRPLYESVAGPPACRAIKTLEDLLREHLLSYHLLAISC